MVKPGEGNIPKEECEHTEDCGTHAFGDPCCQGYFDWMLTNHPRDAVAYIEAGLVDE